MREIMIEEVEVVNGGKTEIGCSTTTTTTKNADGSTTTTKTKECHISHS